MIVDTKMFLDRLSEKSGYDKDECKILVDSFFDVMKEALLSGDTVKIRGYLHLKLNKKRSASGSVQSDSTELIYVPKFSPGKYLYEAARNRSTQERR